MCKIREDDLCFVLQPPKPPRPSSAFKISKQIFKFYQPYRNQMNFILNSKTSARKASSVTHLPPKIHAQTYSADINNLIDICLLHQLVFLLFTERYRVHRAFNLLFSRSLQSRRGLSEHEGNIWHACLPSTENQFQIAGGCGRFLGQ